MASLSDHNSNQSDFSSDQAAILRDLARNGSADEAHMYGCSSDGQANGAAPSMSHTFPDNAPPSTGPSSGLQDLDDPAALLESLANFEHPPSSTSGLPAVSNDHFESLLQAVATAGGQEAAAQAGRGRNRRGARQSTTSNQFSFPQSARTTGRPKRKRPQEEEEEEEEDDDDDSSFGFITTSKRQKQRQAADDPEQLAREREIWGPEDEDEEDGSTTLARQHNIVGGADARAAGVHSAAALFRRPSAASKKYTRPPMSKLFTSLMLTPEQFLHLQAAAKNYMLDPNHPERSDCVGSRGRGDTDMVKLKLFACVKSFLEDEGWGERCFGENAQGAESRTLKWPQMKNKIIANITPLLRRMVTNERQRQYAIETRRLNSDGTSRNDNKRKPRASVTSNDDIPQRSGGERLSAPSPYPLIDPKLNQYHYNIDESFSSGDGQKQPTTQPNDGVSAYLQAAARADVDESIKYLVNIMQDGRRIKPTISLTPSSCSSFSSLVQHIHSIIDNGSQKTRSIKVLAPNGLVDVGDEDGWKAAIADIKQNEWMDGEVRCLVDVEQK